MGPSRVRPPGVPRDAQPESRVVALVPDLMFGSKVVALLESAGHEVTLVDAPARVSAADVVVVDLAGGGIDPIEAVASAPPGARTLAVYSHVDAEARRAALDAGFDVVVPRSRMMREGASLVSGLAG